MQVARDERGRIKKGHSLNPDGRPPKEREAAYFLIWKEVVGLKEFRILCNEAYLGARGKKITHLLNPLTNETKPQIIDDPDSTPSTRRAWFQTIAEYLIGKPVQPIVSDDANGELWQRMKSMFEEMGDFSENELDKLINDGNKVVEKFKAKRERKNPANSDAGDRPNDIPAISAPESLGGADSAAG